MNMPYPFFVQKEKNHDLQPYCNACEGASEPISGFQQPQKWEFVWLLGASGEIT
jgi:hypothetical protein